MPELTTRELYGCMVAELVGEFDLRSVPVLEQFLGEALAGTAPVIILDLSKTLFADLATIRVVVNAEWQASSQGRRLVLAAPQPAVARLLELTGLGWRLSVFATVDEAAARQSTTEDTGSWTPADLPAARIAAGVSGATPATHADRLLARPPADPHEPWPRTDGAARAAARARHSPPPHGRRPRTRHR